MRKLPSTVERKIITRFFLVLIALFIPFAIHAQQRNQVDHIIADTQYCAGNQAQLHSVINNWTKDSTAIVISRPGKFEKSSKFARYRLRTMRLALEDVIEKDKFVLGTGDRTNGRPIVEIYLGGHLKIIFIMPNNKALQIREC